MSVSSADPGKLQAFVTGVSAARVSAASEQSSVAALSSSVIAASPDYHYDVPALAALSAVLEAMGANETFVATVRSELLAADVNAVGAVTVGDAQIAAALANNGVGDPAAARPVRPGDDGRPAADVRVRRRPDLRRQRQHDPPGHRRRVPGDRRRARCRADVELARPRPRRRLRPGLVVGARRSPRRRAVGGAGPSRRWRRGRLRVDPGRQDAGGSPRVAPRT